MSYIGDLVQQADWKKEKHSPVIHCADEVTAGEFFEVKVNIGEEIGHPNTTEHHISWISLFFKPEGDKFTYEVGRYEFNAHGESVKGANEGPVYTVQLWSLLSKSCSQGLYTRWQCAIFMACGKAQKNSK